ncbi:MAG TPA: sigma-54 dependent transcriptional regulator [Anaeromyxobacteraceae bacterium]|nr:sigma-54 dependent transcriptional regulator [Anaeromyxobacteraceae bacterium]
MKTSLDAASPGSLRVLIVDDDPAIRRTLALCLKRLGCVVEEAATGREALSTVQREAMDLVFCDLKLERENGLDLVPRLVSERPQLDVVVITAYAAVDTAVEAMRRGAKDYLPKPFTPAQIHQHVERSRNRRAAEMRAAAPDATFDEAALLIDSASQHMRAALQVLARAATHDVPVLLRGERGAGQGFLARRLHAQSPRCGQPFSAVSCATLCVEDLANDLLGLGRSAAPGAGTGAPEKSKPSEGGTLFLDEIGDLSPAVQARLLPLLREGEHRPRSTDVRIVAATSRDLAAEVRSGHFREDLLYALNVVEVAIPPLRERTEDILPLARALLARLASHAGRDVPVLSRAAEARLVAYSWPGNLPELRNAVERALILSPARVLDPDCFPEPVPEPSAAEPVLGGRFSAEEIEKVHAQRVMSWAGTLEEASRVLGVAVTTLWRKRRKWER